MIAAICDDSAVFRNELKQFLLQYKKDRRIHLDIIQFNNAQELLNYENGFDIVFLDYEMPELDGISAGKILRLRKNVCCIIYITSYPEFVFEAFEVGTYRYFVKPVNFEKLTVALDNFVKEKKMLSPIVINTPDEQLTISSEDIVYLEAAGKCCIIRTVDDTVRSSKTIAKVFGLLPPHCFYRTHKSFAVNFYCIQSVKDSSITLNNGEKVRISRNNMADFKRAYQNFIKYFITRV